MDIFIWDDERGCWVLHERVECPKKEVEHKLLWWSWKSAVDAINTVEYCRLAVSRAKELFKKHSQGVRVVWWVRGDTIWQSGKWHIDTSKYDFYPDAY